jgi:hypothetical protein
MKSNISILSFKQSGEDGEGFYRFHGPLFEITSGYQVPFGEMHQSPPPPNLQAVETDIALRFRLQLIGEKSVTSRSSNVDQKFKGSEAMQDLPTDMTSVQEWLNKIGHVKLGYTAKIYWLSEVEGTIQLAGVTHALRKEQASGEAERGKIVGLHNSALYCHHRSHS